jgi:hypothetical protein
MLPNISSLCFTNSVHSTLSFIRPEIPHLLIDVKGGWRVRLTFSPPTEKSAAQAKEERGKRVLLGCGKFTC